MPIAAGHYGEPFLLKPPDGPVEGLYHPVPLRDMERPLGTEIVLDINDQKRRVSFHIALPFSLHQILN